ncbi:MAG: transglycosylase domain-containing protein [Calditrichota bacterium]
MCLWFEVEYVRHVEVYEDLLVESQSDLVMYPDSLIEIAWIASGGKPGRQISSIYAWSFFGYVYEAIYSTLFMNNLRFPKSPTSARICRTAAWNMQQVDPPWRINISDLARNNKSVKASHFSATVYLSRNWDHSQILSFNLSREYFGRRAYGINNASEVYFRKTLKELTVQEIAILCVLSDGPFYYSKRGRHVFLPRVNEVLAQLPEAEPLTAIPAGLFQD